MGILLYPVALVSLVCWVMTLIRMFTSPEGGALKGVFGIICGLYAFVWGWQNAKEGSHKTVMMIWSVAIVASIALRMMLVVSMK